MLRFRIHLLQADNQAPYIWLVLVLQTGGIYAFVMTTGAVRVRGAGTAWPKHVALNIALSEPARSKIGRLAAVRVSYWTQSWVFIGSLLRDRLLIKADLRRSAGVQREAQHHDVLICDLNRRDAAYISCNTFH